MLYRKNIFVKSDYIGNLGAGTDTKLYIRNNIFYEQSSPYAAIFSYSGANTIIEYNSFLSTDRIAVRSQISPNLVAVNNYWNTNDTNIINGMIYDRNDDLSITNYVEYLPFLLAPHPDTPVFYINQPPESNAGNDQIVFDEVVFDGSQSKDPDGSIVSYEWKLQHRENSAYNRVATGINPTVSDLKHGFYDVSLIVTDNNGAKDTDAMVLAVAGQCTGWPSPNANLDVNSFRITKNKRTGKTTAQMSGEINLPELDLVHGDTVESRITIELFGSLPGGGDLIMAEEVILNVTETNKVLEIRK